MKSFDALVVIASLLVSQLWAFRLQSFTLPTGLTKQSGQLNQLNNGNKDVGSQKNLVLLGEGSKREWSLHMRSYSSGGGSFKPRMDQRLQLNFRKTIKIDPDLKTPITEMNFLPKTIEVLQGKGFEFMTPVQSQSYDLVYGGDDVVARSRTGTGKTFAFGLPLIEKLVRSGAMQDVNPRSRSAVPLVIVLEPTRELAIQVAQELSSVCSEYGMRVQTIYGGSSFDVQADNLRRGVQILVATPGRMLDHITRGTVDLSGIKHVVLDEGDTMLEMGFQKAVESIIRNVKKPGEKSRKAAASALDESYSNDSDDDDEDEETGKAKAAVQMLLFSATMPGWICQLTDKHMQDPVFLDAVQAHETRLADTITHYSLRLPPMARNDDVARILESLILTKGAGGQTIIFTNTKHEADNLVSSACFGQLNCQVLHGDISQASRQTTIKAFKAGNVDVLVATDVAARGLDIAGVDLVLHIAPPNDADTYVHRSGRTGRAGRAGTSILLSQYRDDYKLNAFEKALKFQFQTMETPSAAEVAKSSALASLKKLEKVQDDVVPHFLLSARKLLADTLTDSNLKASDDEQSDESEEEKNKMLSSESFATFKAPVENLLARCLAAISNKAKLTTHTPQPGTHYGDTSRGGGRGGGGGGGSGGYSSGGGRSGGGGGSGGSGGYGGGRSSGKGGYGRGEGGGGGGNGGSRFGSSGLSNRFANRGGGSSASSGGGSGGSSSGDGKRWERPAAPRTSSIRGARPWV